MHVLDTFVLFTKAEKVERFYIDEREYVGAL